MARSGRSRRPSGQSSEHLGKFMGNQLIADSLRLLADGQIGRVVFTEDALRRRDANARHPVILAAHRRERACIQEGHAVPSHQPGHRAAVLQMASEQSVGLPPAEQGR